MKAQTEIDDKHQNSRAIQVVSEQLDEAGCLQMNTQ